MDVDALQCVMEIMRRAVAAEGVEPVAEYMSPGQVEAELPLAIPRKGVGVKDVFALLERVARVTPRTATKRFFNQLYGGRLWPATAADMLTSFLNSSMYTYKVAGVQVLIERAVVARMCAAIGYKDGEGTFAPGGSISNLVAMLVARNEKGECVRDDGLDGTGYVVYSSDQSHYSIIKNAGILGLGRKCVRRVESDDGGRMRVDVLCKEIERDLAEGRVPLLINATAGTTVLGAYDPIEELAEVAEGFGVWLHVDGAWGGTALLSRNTRGLLAGCERADSFTWDAHKMMGVPLIASAVLLKRKGLLEKHFSEDATYLFQADGDGLNPGTGSIQCARRNDALKVWAAWQYYGDEGYEACVDKLCALAKYAAERVAREPGLSLLMQPVMANVCFQVVGKSSEAVCEALDKGSVLKVGYGVFRGEAYIRLVCVNPEMEFADIDGFFDAVIKAG